MTQKEITEKKAKMIEEYGEYCMVYVHKIASYDCYAGPLVEAPDIIIVMMGDTNYYSKEDNTLHMYV